MISAELTPLTNLLYDANYVKREVYHNLYLATLNSRTEVVAGIKKYN